MEKIRQVSETSRGTDRKVFIIGLRTGRLANRLVLFANLVGFAAEHGHRVINVTFHSYAHLFETTRRDIYCRYPAAKRRSIWDIVPGVAPLIRKTRIFYHAVRAASVLNDRHPVFGKKVLTVVETPGTPVPWMDSPEFQGQIRAARTVFIYGWGFRAPDCVKRHAEKIRDYFRPIEMYEGASREAVDRLRKDADMVVGVHIRHGDYSTWKQGRFYFPVERYAAWMRELAEQFPGRKVAFFVCSNEPRHASEFPGLSVGIGAGSPLADLCALAKCDYVLGPVGTFSQWAAFYGNKPLLFLRDQNDSVRLEKFYFTDLCEIP